LILKALCDPRGFFYLLPKKAQKGTKKQFLINPKYEYRNTKQIRNQNDRN
jgi:hypothetical protein